MQYLHKKGLFHRDIKTENILYNHQKEQVKIIDWGFTRKLGDRERAHSVCGTQFAMPPEQALSTREDPLSHDNKVDVWSLGCLMLDLVGVGPLGSLKIIKQGQIV